MNEICKCIKLSNDKELLLVLLDENIRNEESEIIKIKTLEEEIIMSEVIDINEITNLEHLVNIHEEYIEKIRNLIYKIENTEIC